MKTTDNINSIIERISNMHPYKEKGNRDSYSEYNQGWSDACDILGNKIIEHLKHKQKLALKEMMRKDEESGLY